jgi:Nickel/cobalt transporter regulator
VPQPVPGQTVERRSGSTWGDGNRDWRGQNRQDGDRSGRSGDGRSPDGNWNNRNGNDRRWSDRNRDRNPVYGHDGGRNYGHDRDRRHDGYSRGSRGWNYGWRNDNRYDWNSHRNRYRDQYRIGRYYNPYGYSRGYSRFSIGFFLDSGYYSDRYWINDPWSYRLPDAYGSYRWVRYYDDALLVDIYSGEVVDVIHNFFY